MKKILQQAVCKAILDRFEENPDDSFVPFCVNMESEPRVVASALAMSTLPFVPEPVSEKLADAYDRAYEDSFYGSATELFDDPDIPEEWKKFSAEFTEYGCTGSSDKREKMRDICPELFKELDEWTKSNLNGDTLDGCCSLATTDPENGKIIFERSYSEDELARIVKDSLAEEIESIFDAVEGNFEDALKDSAGPGM